MRTKTASIKQLFAAVFFLAFASGVCADADGSLDTKFNPNAGVLISDPIMLLAPQADGKIFVATYMWYEKTVGLMHHHIVRLNPDGSVDGSFNADSITGGISSILVQDNGKIIIVGSFSAVYGITRLHADGSLDTSFNRASGFDKSITAIAMQADGKIIAVGGFHSYKGAAVNNIARFNADGTFDTSFNAGSGVSGLTSAGVKSVALQSDGKLLIGGRFSTVNNTAHDYMARLNVDGSVDASFNPTFNSNVYKILVQTDGKILVGGIFTQVNDTSTGSVIRLNSDGSLDNSFNKMPTTSTVDTMALQSDGKIVVGGRFGIIYSGGTAMNIVRLNVDGSLDGNFNSGSGAGAHMVNSGVNSVVIQTDGKIVIGGVFDNYNWVYRKNIVRIHGSNVDACIKNNYVRKGIAGWIWKGEGNGYETQSQIWQLSAPFYSTNWAVPDRTYPPLFADQPNWDIVTVGSFNKCGDVDILWRHKTTAQWLLWQMQNGTRVAKNNLPDFDLAHEWQVVGAGDTDKDGDDDVILNNTQTGGVMIWEMQGHTIVTMHNVGAKPGYVLSRIGDFNKDIDADLLFRQVDGDALVIWEIQNHAMVAEHALANVGVGFSAVCAGDFDRDGDDDIFLISTSDNQEKWFEMDNYARVKQHFGSGNSGFVFKGCGDYDGDGNTDILWQRSADAMNRAVLQQGWGTTKQTVYTNPFGGEQPGAAGYGFKYRNNSN